MTLAVAAAAFLGLAGAAVADAQVVWKRQFGTAESEAARAVAIDRAGNVVIAGDSYSFDVFVAKYGPGGRLLWKRRLGTPGWEFTHAVATDGDDNIFIAGESDGSLGGPNRGTYDAWLAKYDAAGRLLWKRPLGTAFDEELRGLAVDSGGNAVIAGSTRGALAGVSRGSYDAFIAKYDPDGRLLWKRQGGTAGFDGVQGVATDGHDNVVVCGIGSLAAAPDGGNDAFVAKYDAGGTLLWERQLGTSEADQASGVAIDRTGSIFVAGSTESPGGDSEAWVAKVDRVGRRLWVEQIGSLAAGMATDGSGNVIIAGSTSGALGGYDVDAWIVSYDPGGTLLWKKQMGTPESDYGEGVATDGRGTIVFAGGTLGSFAGPQRGQGDAWVVKLREE